MESMNIETLLHKNSSPVVKEIITNTPGLVVKYNLGEALKARGVTQKKLAILTGLRQATISDLITGKNVQINKANIIAIMVALRITDIREIIDISFSQEVLEQFTKEASTWKETKKTPQSVVAMAISALENLV